jgi:hypothetical protein
MYKQLTLHNFKIKFIQNKLFSTLPYFYSIRSYLTGQNFCVLKEHLNFSDFLILQDLISKNSHILLFYLDNRFYTDDKLKFLNKLFKNNTYELPYTAYFYFLLKLGFILKFEKLNKVGLV